MAKDPAARPQEINLTRRKLDFLMLADGMDELASQRQGSPNNHRLGVMIIVTMVGYA